VLSAITPEQLERLAVPIGVGLAILLTLAIPALRRGLVDSYRAGAEAREKHPRLAWLANVAGVVLLIVLLLVWLLR
jgi:hypothetical protein